MNKRLLLNTPRKLLLAIAQVIEDYPERWTGGSFARTNKGGKPAFVSSSQATCFCFIGMADRLCLEGATNEKVRDETLEHLYEKTKQGAAPLNDRLYRQGERGRKRFVAILRKAAESPIIKRGAA